MTHYIHDLEAERDALKELVESIKHDLRLTQDAHIEALDARDKLKAECEILLWNLTGCDTIAMGYGDGKFSEEMARPALRSVAKLAKDRDAWKQKAEGLAGALTSISKNGCCDSCQEAKLVAKAALEEYEKLQ